jgi:galactokinase
MEERREKIKELLKFEFKNSFGDDRGLIISMAPGRINLIGEHTDYNDGFVLPITIDRAVYIALRKRKDKNCFFYSVNFKESSSWSLDELKRVGGHHWSNYLKGVMKFLIEEGFKIEGVEGVIYGDIPIGSGLSSSAAIEVATGFGLQNLFELDIEPLKLILLCKRAENEFVGVQCGIMDQFVSRLGKRENALLIDCRSLDYENIPFKMDEYKILIVDTRIKRELAGSVYNQRRKECENALKFFNKIDNSVKALRDVSWEFFMKEKEKLPENISRRVAHVISENGRVLSAFKILKNGKMKDLGPLLFESHKSLKENYEVSCEELDFIVDFSKSFGAEGARLTGAGFGGCAIVLLKRKLVKDFTENLSKSYNKKFSSQPNVIPLEYNLQIEIIK